MKYLVIGFEVFHEWGLSMLSSSIAMGNGGFSHKGTHVRTPPQGAGLCQAQFSSQRKPNLLLGAAIFSII